MTKLSAFEGLEVVGSSIELPNAAGGLREALKIDPVELHHGDEFHVTFKCKVRKVRFDPTDKDEFDGPQHRVHVADVVTAAIVEEDDNVGEALSSMADRIEAAKQLAGQAKLPTSPPFLGYDDLTESEVAERLDEADLDLVDRVEAYEEANGGRGAVLNACASARKVLESKL